MTGTTLGTVDYMRPEQVEGKERTLACDFYSLGVMLYEMEMGQVPYSSKNPVTVMVLHASAPVSTLPESIARTPLRKALI